MSQQPIEITISPPGTRVLGGYLDCLLVSEEGFRVPNMAWNAFLEGVEPPARTTVIEETARTKGLKASTKQRSVSARAKPAHVPTSLRNSEEPVYTLVINRRKDPPGPVRPWDRPKGPTGPTHPQPKGPPRQPPPEPKPKS